MLRYLPEELGLHVCRRCMRILAAPCKQKSGTYTPRPCAATTPVWRGDDRAPPTRTSNASAAHAAHALNAPFLPGSAPIRDLPSLVDSILTPLRSSGVNNELPGPILDRAALSPQRLPRELHFADKDSAAEDRAFANLFIAYQLDFRKAMKGDTGWRTGSGRLAVITARLSKAETGDFTGM